VIKKAQKSKRGAHIQAQNKGGSSREGLHGTVFVARPYFLKNLLWIALFLVTVNIIIYTPVMHYGFLSWDDPAYITQNPEVSQGLTWKGALWAFTTGHAANWHPVTWLSHMLDVQLYGLKDAGSHHFTNILLHILNSLLLFWALCRMTGTWRPSAMVAALFAVHPIHVESVAWLAERKDVLATFFWMLTCHAYISYSHRPSFRRYMVVLIFFALGLMSKPMLVTLPLVLLLLDIWPLGRVRLETRQGSVWMHLIREKMPLFLLAAASSAATIVAQSRGDTIRDFSIFPLNVRLYNAAVSYVAYISKTLWPRNLAAFYPYESWSGWLIIGAFLLLITVSILGIYGVRKHPYFLVGWLWYLGTLVPVIGIVQVGNQARADRYAYVPLIGVFIMLVWGAPVLLGKWRHHGTLLQAIASILIICALVAVARNQVRYWESDLTLWEHSVQSTGNNYFSRNLLGSALANHGRLTEAIAQYSECLRLNPDYAEAHNGLGAVFFSQGRTVEAMDHYTEAIRIKPGLAEAHSNRGAVLWLQGKGEEAISEFQTALKIKPDSAETHYNYGYVLADQGKTDEAIGQLHEALRINPEYVEAYNRLGNALAIQGKTNDAIEQYTKALSIRSDFAGAHNNLGIALVNQNRYEEAIIHFREALRLDPKFEDARINLETALEDLAPK
jgi:Tfp pilus assembly protein PilF